VGAGPPPVRLVLMEEMARGVRHIPSAVAQMGLLRVGSKSKLAKIPEMPEK
jgi:hypothetical protein